MKERIREELNEDQLLNIAGGTENKSAQTDEKCPVCKKGYLKKTGSKYVCQECFRQFVKETCSSCGMEKLCVEYTGGRYKCTSCSPVI